VIWNWYPPVAENLGGEKPYYSDFNRGEAVIVLASIHGDRLIADGVESPPSGRGTTVVVDVEAQPYDPEEPPLPDWAVNAIKQAEGKDDVSYAWDYLKDGNHGYVVRFTGDVVSLWWAFYEAANRLDPECDATRYCPGGDDDTYDYYPDAFDALVEFGRDLDELDRRLQVLGWEPKQFTAYERIVRLLRNLYRAKGPFTEWEFDLAEPYREHLPPEAFATPSWGEGGKPFIPGTLMKEQ
jgi:hypothetical protein